MQATPSFFASSLLPKTSPPGQMPKICGGCGAPCACAKYCGSCFTARCNSCMAEGETHCLHCQHYGSTYLVQQACYNCGTTSLGDSCKSCSSPVSQTCMVEEQGCCNEDIVKEIVKEIVRSKDVSKVPYGEGNCTVDATYQIHQPCVDQVVEPKCDNCGTICNSAKFCYGCATTVCDTCMDDEEACCLLCLDTYPSYSSARVRSRPVAAPTLTTKGHSSYLSIDQLFTQPPQAPKTAPKTGFLLEPLTFTKPPQETGDCCKEMIVDNVSIAFKRAEIRRASLVSTVSTAAPESPTRKDRWSDLEVGSGESTCLDEESDDGFSSKEGKESSTMMICNIPCRLSQDAVIDAIHSAGFAGTYDFVYLPDRKNRRANGARTSGNIGYAFVNFKNMQHAEAFSLSFHNFQFPGTRSAKRCTLKYAHCQGFNAKESPCSRRPRGNW